MGRIQRGGPCVWSEGKSHGGEAGGQAGREGTRRPLEGLQRGAHDRQTQRVPKQPSSWSFPETLAGVGWGGVGSRGRCGREASFELAVVTQVRTTGGGQEERSGGEAGGRGWRFWIRFEGRTNNAGLAE